MDGVYNASSTTAVSSNPGQGTAAWLTAFETEISTRDGNINSNYLQSDMWKMTSKVASAGTYTFYVISVQMPDDSVLVKEDNPTLQIFIACPSADTGSGKAIFAIDNILAVL